MHLRLILAAAFAVGLSIAAQAQQQWPGVTLYDNKGAPIGTATNPFTVTGISGGGGGGNLAVTSNSTDSQAVSATNQQNVVYNYVFNGTTWDRVRGTGGSINTAITGTLPAFAATPTFNLGTLNGAATAANQNVTVAGTSATSAQAVQGVTGGVPQNVANGGTFAVQNTATIVGGNATAVKTDSSATTQPISAAGLPLPSGAATAANQSSEITSLQAIALRGVPYSEASVAAISASASAFGAVRDAGALSPWSRFNALVNSTQAGTLVVQGSNDNFTTGVIVSSTAVTANTSLYVTVPLMYRYHRAYLTNGATAGTYSMNTSYTAN